MFSSSDESVRLIESLSWELVAEYGTLQDILALRLASTVLTCCIQQLSHERCAQLLQERLIHSQLTMVSETWNRPYQAYLAFMMQSKSGAFDTLIRTFRVMKHLPQHAAVGFSGKYGRHVIPMQWNSEASELQPFAHPSCNRLNCPTCRFRIPIDADPSAQIYSCLLVRSKDGVVDATAFFPKCIPNLPPDLLCPYCCHRNERTLVLSVLSYKSSSANNDYKVLSFTPYNDEDFEETENDGSDEDNDDGEDARHDQVDEDPDRVKPKRPCNRPQFAFPQLFSEVVVSQTDLSTPWDDQLKCVVAIHCTSCQHFGVAAPASPCWHDNFHCHHAFGLLSFGNQESRTGIIVTRQVCSHQDCNKATLCPSCCNRYEHRGKLKSLVRYKCWCKHCHPGFSDGIYCSEHDWITTVCHHW